MFSGEFSSTEKTQNKHRISVQYQLANFIDDFSGFLDTLAMSFKHAVHCRELSCGNDKSCEGLFIANVGYLGY